MRRAFADLFKIDGVESLSMAGRTDHAILTDLAAQGPDRLVSLSEIAERQDISLAYLEQLFVKLRRAEIVESVRGPGGGYRLARPVGEIRISEILAAVDASVKLVFICSPNNPTGQSMARADIERICRETAGRALVVIDEAYHEFAAGGDFLDLRNRYEHVVLLRTLSKFVSLAGVRCGLIVGAPELIEFAQVDRRMRRETVQLVGELRERMRR